ncbi:MAG: hypothetical protein AAF787_11820, partial [Chloroflexota bacterium]
LSTSLQWLPDSRHLIFRPTLDATSLSYLDLLQMDVATKQVTAIGTFNQGNIEKVSLSPDGKWLTVQQTISGTSSMIEIMEMDTGERFMLLNGAANQHWIYLP